MQHQHKTKTNGLSLAFWLNLLFSIIEFIGGILTNSTAIIADAFHDFMDAIAIGAAVLLEKISGKKRTSKFSYGYRRFSLLAALGMSIFLLAGAVIMVVAAIQSFIAPKEVHSLGMLWLALLGVAINGFAFLRIRNSGEHQHHTHHGHSHGENHNRKAILLHLLEDVLGWVAVLIGAIIIYYTNWYWIDGVLTLGIAIFIGYNATKNLGNTLSILLQSVPEDVDIQQLTNELNQIEGVNNIHDLHVWSMDGSYHIGSLHVVVTTENKQGDNRIFSAIAQLLEEHRILHPTIQIEDSYTDCRLTDC